MSTAPQFLPILGPVVAACIAAIVSFLALVISKEQKTSEFRQAWIDGLRGDLTEFAANLRRLEAQPTFVDLRAITGSTLRDAIEVGNERALRPDFFAENRLRLLQSRYAIRLRLNPTEPDGVVLLAQVDKALEVYYSSGGVEGELDNLMALAQPFLKKEWERVKSGEPVFRGSVIAAKWLAACLGSAALIFAIFWVWKVASAT
ncbi:MAG: hypothetical protein V4669_04815 [Pseudomonadota bacterium]